MSGLNPTGPSQPTQQAGYETKGNPAQQEPAEKKAAASHNDGRQVDQRIPTKQTSSVEEATPTSLGRGIHGAPPGEEAHGGTEETMGRSRELDGEQMRAPGEGEVADAVESKPGATGEQDDLAGDLDKKRGEQAALRGEPSAESGGVDVQSVLRNR